MTITMSPVSFNGQLGDAITIRNNALKLKQQHFDSKANLNLSAQDEIKKIINASSELNLQAEDTLQLANSDYKYALNQAQTDLSNNNTQAATSFNEGKNAAKTALLNAQLQTKKMAEQLKELAQDAEYLKNEARQNLKEIRKTATPFKNAAENLEEVNIQETEEVTTAVSSAMNAATRAKNAVIDALNEFEKLEQQEKAVIEKQTNTAKLKKTQAKETLNTGTINNRDNFRAELARLKEEQARALDKAKEAYRNQIAEAENVLQQYTDLAGANMEKASKLEKQLNEMKQTARNIKIRAMFVRASNLPDLTGALIGLGKIGEAATAPIAERIIRTLKQFDWFATIPGKLGATEAAKMFLNNGTENQKVVMSTGIEINASKIVQRTQNPEVLDALANLDEQIDSVNLHA